MHRSGKEFTVWEKLEAVRRIRQGETKARVGRSLGLAESTLRGWCKAEWKMLEEVRRKEEERPELGSMDDARRRVLETVKTKRISECKDLDGAHRVLEGPGMKMDQEMKSLEDAHGMFLEEAKRKRIPDLVTLDDANRMYLEEAKRKKNLQVDTLDDSHRLYLEEAKRMRSLQEMELKSLDEAHRRFLKAIQEKDFHELRLKMVSDPRGDVDMNLNERSPGNPQTPHGSLLGSHQRPEHWFREWYKDHRTAPLSAANETCGGKVSREEACRSGQELLRYLEQNQELASPGELSLLRSLVATLSTTSPPLQRRRSRKNPPMRCFLR